jgi:predicted nucleic acid-binding Zn ribbon protein
VTAQADLLASVSVERRAAAAHHVLPGIASEDERWLVLAIVVWPDGVPEWPANRPEVDVSSSGKVEAAPWGRCEYEACGWPLPEPPRRSGKRRRFCCRGCAQMARSAATRPARECRGCGETFQPLQTTSRYCSEACYLAAYRRRRSASADQPQTVVVEPVS